MKNKHYERFENALDALAKEGIETMKELNAHEMIKDELWLSLIGFINHVILHSKSYRNSAGERKDGNWSRVCYLVMRGVDIEDIRSDILLHIMERFDKVLQVEEKRRLSYVFVIGNNKIVDMLRSMPPKGLFVSWEEIVFDNDSDNECTLERYIADSAPSPAEEIIMKETIHEIWESTRNRIVNEMCFLSSKPEELFVRICLDYLKMKPAALTKYIVAYGAERCFAEALIRVAKKYHIKSVKISECLARGILREELLKYDVTNPDNAKISAQISRLSWRATNRIKKLI